MDEKQAREMVDGPSSMLARVRELMVLLASNSLTEEQVRIIEIEIALLNLAVNIHLLVYTMARR